MAAFLSENDAVDPINEKIGPENLHALILAESVLISPGLDNLGNESDSFNEFNNFDNSYDQTHGQDDQKSPEFLDVVFSNSSNGADDIDVDYNFTYGNNNNTQTSSEVNNKHAETNYANFASGVDVSKNDIHVEQQLQPSAQRHAQNLDTMKSESKSSNDDDKQSEEVAVGRTKSALSIALEKRTGGKPAKISPNGGAQQFKDQKGNLVIQQLPFNVNQMVNSTNFC